MLRTHFYKGRYLILGIMLALAVILVINGCGINHLMETTYHIGQDNRWGTINLMGKEKNLTAFNNQLLSAIGKEEEIRLVVEIDPSADLINKLDNGELQGILTALQASYLHEERLLFSPPFFLTGPVLIIPLAAPLEGWNEKGKKIIGISHDSHLASTLEQDPTIQIKIYHDILKALTDLIERNIDGAIFPAIPSYTYVNAFYKTELKIATLPLTDEGVRLVVQNNEQGKELLELFNKGLTSLKENGTFTKLLDSWGFVNV